MKLELDIRLGGVGDTFLLNMELGTGSSDFGNTYRHTHGRGVMDTAGLILNQIEILHHHLHHHLTRSIRLETQPSFVT